MMIRDLSKNILSMLSPAILRLAFFRPVSIESFPRFICDHVALDFCSATHCELNSHAQQHVVKCEFE